MSRTRLAVQKAEDMTATTFEEDNISVLPSDQGQAPGKLHPCPSDISSVHVHVVCFTLVKHVSLWTLSCVFAC